MKPREFEHLIKPHMPIVRKAARKIRSRIYSEEDVEQEILAEIWRDFKGRDVKSIKKSTIRGLIFTIANRAVSDLIRKIKRQKRYVNEVAVSLNVSLKDVKGQDEADSPTLSDVIEDVSVDVEDEVITSDLVNFIDSILDDDQDVDSKTERGLKRSRQVFHYIKNGMHDAGIARILGVSPVAVSHIRRRYIIDAARQWEEA